MTRKLYQSKLHLKTQTRIENTMTIRKIATTVLFSGMILVLAGMSLAGGTGGVPAVDSQALNRVQLRSFPVLDNALLAEEDLLREESGLPFRFAISRDVQITPENSGTWEALNDGRLLWRHRFACPEVLSLNLGFTGYHLPQSATLLVYSTDGTGPVYRYNADDNRSSGQLWTPVLMTNALVIELEVAAADRQKVTLELGSVNCGYRGFGKALADKSGSCNIDVVCPEGDDWVDESASVGVYTLNGFWSCTGALVNNTAEDERPLFLTANHCDISDLNVSTMVVYWNFQNPVCGEPNQGVLVEGNYGSALLASSATSDFALVELDGIPDPVHAVTYAGWDRSDTTPQSAVAIHHPSTDEKSISFEDDPLSITTYLQEPVPGNSTHLRITDWDLGTTEPGSSGSPLFNDEHRIVGQLHGGYASCTSATSDWYGRIFTSWEGDGAPENRLRDYLDPAGTGVMFLNRLGDVDPEPEPIPPGEWYLYFASATPNPFTDEVEVIFQMNEPGQVRARVFNVKGYMIRDLGEVSGNSGENSLTWDGFDDNGRSMPAGMYLFYLECGERTARGQVIRLR